MVQTINESIGVVSSYKNTEKTVVPYKMFWRGREYHIREVGYYHKRVVGSFTEHIFDVTDGVNSYRLVCRAETLAWRLEEISDADPN